MNRNALLVGVGVAMSDPSMTTLGIHLSCYGRADRKRGPDDRDETRGLDQMNAGHCRTARPEPGMTAA